MPDMAYMSLGFSVPGEHREKHHSLVVLQCFSLRAKTRSQATESIVCVEQLRPFSSVHQQVSNQVVQSTSPERGAHPVSMEGWRLDGINFGRHVNYFRTVLKTCGIVCVTGLPR